MSRQHDEYEACESLAMPPEVLADLEAELNAGAADYRAYMAEMAARDAELGPWPSDAEIAEYEDWCRQQRRVGT